MSPLELLVILAICLLFCGATKLPKLAKSVGESVNIFKETVKSGESGAEEDVTQNKIEKEEKR